MDKDLESLYKEAQSALKAKDYDSASDLLRQILKADVDYKDSAQLLARVIKLSRRRWYNDPRLWGVLAILFLVVLGIYLYPKLQNLTGQLAPRPVVFPSDTPALTMAPPATATATSIPTPTPIPITWKRVSIGQEFERDTVTAIVIDPKDPEVLYAGMKNAGIFKSIDGGLSWRPAHQGLAHSHVTSLLIDFQDPRILYAGTDAGTYKTEDSGENWYKFAEETYLLMDPQDSSHLYKRDSGAIYATTDQGHNWEAVYTTKDGCPGEILGWDIHPTDGDTLFVGGGEFCEPGLYMSSDGGRSWGLFAKIKIREGGYTIHDMGLENPDIGLDEQGTLYFHLGPSGSSSDRGVKHEQGGMWRTILNLDYSVPIAIFDSLGSVYFYCDTRLCRFDLDKRQKATLGEPDVGDFTVIAVSPSNPNTIYVGGEGLAVSKDGGMTWSKLNNGLGSTFLSLEAERGNTGRLYVLAGNCLERKIELEGYFDQGQEGFVQSLYVSTDRGVTWNFSTRPGCYLVKDADGVTLYRYSYSAGWGGASQQQWVKFYIWRSQDAGESWELVTVPSWEPTTVTADPVQSGLVYLYSPGYIFETEWVWVPYGYVSEDYGQNWKKMDSPVDAKLCYGSTLQFIDAHRPMAVDPSDGNHVLVIDNGTLLESHDSCETTNMFATAPSASMNTIAFDRNTSSTLYAGTDEGAYISFDSGATWHQINDGLLGATVVYSIVVDNESNIYAATPYGVFKLEGK
jgi:photosystem II stability/assembly factor-like uncharacterized protein